MRLLAAIDFSPCSQRALDYALCLARSLGASLDVLHVWTLPAALPSASPVRSPGGAPTLESFAQSEAERQMSEFLAGVDRAGYGGPLGTVIRFGSEAAVIVEAAAEYDLLVMGTNGRTGVKRLLLGSIAEEVIRRAPCPVVTIREPR